MRVLTPVDLQSALDSELVWRRREVTTLVALIKTADFASQRALVRAGIPLLYAHWEGFGKVCGLRYLEYVSYRAKKFTELKPSFIYLELLPKLKDISNSSPEEVINLLRDMNLHLEKTNKNAFRKRISTKSNLRYDVLTEMLSMCGIDYTPFADHASFIDHELCDPRNEIAHGVGGAPPVETFIRRRDKAFAIMTELQNCIINSAVESKYMLNA